MKKQVIVRRFSVEALIEVLGNLYHNGVDYVDLYAKKDEEGEDTVGISFSQEYMNEEYVDGFDELTALDDSNITPEMNEEENKEVKPLSSEDINQLL